MTHNELEKSELTSGQLSGLYPQTLLCPRVPALKIRRGEETGGSLFVKMDGTAAPQRWSQNILLVRCRWTAAINTSLLLILDMDH